LSDARQVADERLEDALEVTGARDPREFYREQLKALKEHDEAAYEAAVAYYRDTLIPSIADRSSDPLPAWTLYGKRLAELTHEGRTVAIDVTGRSQAWEAWVADELVLHLPEEARTRAVLVQLPPDPSDAQRATYSWLVAGRNKLPDA